jgi:hypothetical protein
VLGLRLAVWGSYAHPVLSRWRLRWADRQVLACVLAGYAGPLAAAGTITVIARLAGPVSRWELYGCRRTSDRDCRHTSGFSLVDEATGVSMLGHGIHAFSVAAAVAPDHFFVRAHLRDRHRDSMIVRSKAQRGPTSRRTGALRLAAERPLTVVWDRAADGTWISFSMILDGDRMLAGVYTWARRWRVGSVARLPFYYHDAARMPPIDPGRRYTVLRLGIDPDGWVPTVDVLPIEAPAVDRMADHGV